MYILSYKTFIFPCCILSFFKFYSNEFFFCIFSFFIYFYLASLFRKFYNFYYVFLHLFTMHTAISLTIDFFLGKIMLFIMRSRTSREFSSWQNR